MALFYSNKKPDSKKPSTLTAEISALDYQGLGVAKINGKTWFIENALPPEKVEFAIIEEKRQYGRGQAKRWLTTSPQRQQPECGYFQRCGGCQNQHISIDQQRAAKQQALQHKLSRLQSQPIEFMPMISGEPWHYRRRVRLAMQVNPKSRQLEIGLRQKNSNAIVPISQCLVAEPAINALLPALQSFFSQWPEPKALGHLELVAADNGVALLLRYLKNFSETPCSFLQQFAEQHQLMLFVQANDGIHQLCGEQPFYQLEDGSKLAFDVRDFIQINRQLNQKMIDCALDWLDLQPQDRVLDLFCGMGNFTLPISRKVTAVVGVEGVAEMVAKAQKNAQQNERNNIQFFQADLDQPFADQPWASQPFNKILLDPPRSGAAFALNALCQLGAQQILYVSCNPATLVRDAEILLQAGYRLERVAMIDMFPQTGHLESISLFRQQK